MNPAKKSSQPAGINQNGTVHGSERPARRLSQTAFGKYGREPQVLTPEIEAVLLTLLDEGKVAGEERQPSGRRRPSEPRSSHDRGNHREPSNRPDTDVARFAWVTVLHGDASDFCLRSLGAKQVYELPAPANFVFTPENTSALSTLLSSLIESAANAVSTCSTPTTSDPQEPPLMPLMQFMEIMDILICCFGDYIAMVWLTEATLLYQPSNRLSRLPRNHPVLNFNSRESTTTRLDDLSNASVTANSNSDAVAGAGADAGAGAGAGPGAGVTSVDRRDSTTRGPDLSDETARSARPERAPKVWWAWKMTRLTEDLMALPLRAGRCSRFWEGEHTAYRCNTCSLVSSSCVCANCFHLSDHRGHDYVTYRSELGGCCDCGDAAAWRDSGFCNHHPPQRVAHDYVAKVLRAAEALKASPSPNHVMSDSDNSEGYQILFNRVAYKADHTAGRPLISRGDEMVMEGYEKSQRERKERYLRGGKSNSTTTDMPPPTDASLLLSDSARVRFLLYFFVVEQRLLALLWLATVRETRRSTTLQIVDATEMGKLMIVIEGLTHALVEWGSLHQSIRRIICVASGIGCPKSSQGSGAEVPLPLLTFTASLAAFVDASDPDVQEILQVAGQRPTFSRRRIALDAVLGALGSGSSSFGEEMIFGPDGGWNVPSNEIARSSDRTENASSASESGFATSNGLSDASASDSLHAFLMGMDHTHTQNPNSDSQFGSIHGTSVGDGSTTRASTGLHSRSFSQNLNGENVDRNNAHKGEGMAKPCLTSFLEAVLFLLPRLKNTGDMRRNANASSPKLSGAHTWITSLILDMLFDRNFKLAFSGEFAKHYTHLMLANDPAMDKLTVQLFSISEVVLSLLPPPMNEGFQPSSTTSNFCERNLPSAAYHRALAAIMSQINRNNPAMLGSNGKLAGSESADAMALFPAFPVDLLPAFKMTPGCLFSMLFGVCFRLLARAVVPNQTPPRTALAPPNYNRKRTLHALCDMRTALLDSEALVDLLLQHPQAFTSEVLVFGFVPLLSLTQYATFHRRRTMAHVEFEDNVQWTNALIVCSDVFTTFAHLLTAMARRHGRPFASEAWVTQISRTFVAATALWTRGALEKEMQMPIRDDQHMSLLAETSSLRVHSPVSKLDVSIHCGLFRACWFVSWLFLQNGLSIQDAAVHLASFLPSDIALLLDHPPESKDREQGTGSSLEEEWKERQGTVSLPFLFLLSDYPLRALVLCFQQSAMHLWNRNGAPVAQEVYLYRKHYWACNFMEADLLCVQLALYMVNELDSYHSRPKPLLNKPTAQDSVVRSIDSTRPGREALHASKEMSETHMEVMLHKGLLKSVPSAATLGPVIESFAPSTLTAYLEFMASRFELSKNLRFVSDNQASVEDTGRESALSHLLTLLAHQLTIQLSPVLSSTLGDRGMPSALAEDHLEILLLHRFILPRTNQSERSFSVSESLDLCTNPTIRSKVIAILAKWRGDGKDKGASQLGKKSDKDNRPSSLLSPEISALSPDSSPEEEDEGKNVPSETETPECLENTSAFNRRVGHDGWLRYDPAFLYSAADEVQAGEQGFQQWLGRPASRKPTPTQSNAQTPIHTVGFVEAAKAGKKGLGDKRLALAAEEAGAVEPNLIKWYSFQADISKHLNVAFSPDSDARQKSPLLEQKRSREQEKQGEWGAESSWMRELLKCHFDTSRHTAFKALGLLSLLRVLECLLSTRNLERFLYANFKRNNDYPEGSWERILPVFQPSPELIKTNFRDLSERTIRSVFYFLVRLSINDEQYKSYSDKLKQYESTVRSHYHSRDSGDISGDDIIDSEKETAETRGEKSGPLTGELMLDWTSDDGLTVHSLSKKLIGSCGAHCDFIPFLMQPMQMLLSDGVMVEFSCGSLLKAIKLHLIPQSDLIQSSESWISLLLSKFPQGHVTEAEAQEQRRAADLRKEDEARQTETAAQKQAAVMEELKILPEGLEEELSRLESLSPPNANPSCPSLGESAANPLEPLNAGIPSSPLTSMAALTTTLAGRDSEAVADGGSQDTFFEPLDVPSKVDDGCTPASPENIEKTARDEGKWLPADLSPDDAITPPEIAPSMAAAAGGAAAAAEAKSTDAGENKAEVENKNQKTESKGAEPKLCVLCRTSTNTFENPLCLISRYQFSSLQGSSGRSCSNRALSMSVLLKELKKHAGDDVSYEGLSDCVKRLIGKDNETLDFYYDSTIYRRRAAEAACGKAAKCVDGNGDGEGDGDGDGDSHEGKGQDGDRMNHTSVMFASDLDSSSATDYDSLSESAANEGGESDSAGSVTEDLWAGNGALPMGEGTVRGMEGRKGRKGARGGKGTRGKGKKNVERDSSWLDQHMVRSELHGSITTVWWSCGHYLHKECCRRHRDADRLRGMGAVNLDDWQIVPQNLAIEDLRTPALLPQAPQPSAQILAQTRTRPLAALGGDLDITFANDDDIEVNIITAGPEAIRRARDNNLDLTLPDGPEIERAASSATSQASAFSSAPSQDSAGDSEASETSETSETSAANGSDSGPTLGETVAQASGPSAEMKDTSNSGSQPNFQSFSRGVPYAIDQTYFARRLDEHHANPFFTTSPRLEPLCPYCSRRFNCLLPVMLNTPMPPLMPPTVQPTTLSPLKSTPPTSLPTVLAEGASKMLDCMGNFHRKIMNVSLPPLLESVTYRHVLAKCLLLNSLAMQANPDLVFHPAWSDLSEFGCTVAAKHSVVAPSIPVQACFQSSTNPDTALGHGADTGLAGGGLAGLSEPGPARPATCFHLLQIHPVCLAADSVANAILMEEQCMRQELRLRTHKSTALVIRSLLSLFNSAADTMAATTFTLRPRSARPIRRSAHPPSRRRDGHQSHRKSGAVMPGPPAPLLEVRRILNQEGKARGRAACLTGLDVVRFNFLSCMFYGRTCYAPAPEIKLDRETSSGEREDGRESNPMSWEEVEGTKAQRPCLYDETNIAIFRSMASTRSRIVWLARLLLTSSFSDFAARRASDSDPASNGEKGESDGTLSFVCLHFFMIEFFEAIRPWAPTLGESAWGSSKGGSLGRMENPFTDVMVRLMGAIRVRQQKEPTRIREPFASLNDWHLRTQEAAALRCTKPLDSGDCEISEISERRTSTSTDIPTDKLLVPHSAMCAPACECRSRRETWEDSPDAMARAAAANITKVIRQFDTASEECRSKRGGSKHARKFERPRDQREPLIEDWLAQDAQDRESMWPSDAGEGGRKKTGLGTALGSGGMDSRTEHRKEKGISCTAGAVEEESSKRRRLEGRLVRRWRRYRPSRADKLPKKGGEKRQVQSLIPSDPCRKSPPSGRALTPSERSVPGNFGRTIESTSPLAAASSPSYSPVSGSDAQNQSPSQPDSNLSNSNSNSDSNSNSNSGSDSPGSGFHGEEEQAFATHFGRMLSGLTELSANTLPRSEHDSRSEAQSNTDANSGSDDWDDVQSEASLRSLLELAALEEGRVTEAMGARQEGSTGSASTDGTGTNDVTDGAVHTPRNSRRRTHTSRRSRPAGRARHRNALARGRATASGTGNGTGAGVGVGVGVGVGNVSGRQRGLVQATGERNEGGRRLDRVGERGRHGRRGRGRTVQSNAGSAHGQERETSRANAVTRRGAVNDRGANAAAHEGNEDILETLLISVQTLVNRARATLNILGGSGPPIQAGLSPTTQFVRPPSTEVHHCDSTAPLALPAFSKGSFQGLPQDVILRFARFLADQHETEICKVRDDQVFRKRKLYMQSMDPPIPLADLSPPTKLATTPASTESSGLSKITKIGLLGTLPLLRSLSLLCKFSAPKEGPVVSSSSSSSAVTLNGGNEGKGANRDLDNRGKEGKEGVGRRDRRKRQDDDEDGDCVTLLDENEIFENETLRSIAYEEYDCEKEISDTHLIALVHALTKDTPLHFLSLLFPMPHPEPQSQTQSQHQSREFEERERQEMMRVVRDVAHESWYFRSVPEETPIRADGSMAKNTSSPICCELLVENEAAESLCFQIEKECYHAVHLVDTVKSMDPESLFLVYWYQHALLSTFYRTTWSDYVRSIYSQPRRRPNRLRSARNQNLKQHLEGTLEQNAEQNLEPNLEKRFASVFAASCVLASDRDFVEEASSTKRFKYTVNVRLFCPYFCPLPRHYDMLFHSGFRKALPKISTLRNARLLGSRAQNDQNGQNGQNGMTGDSQGQISATIQSMMTPEAVLHRPAGHLYVCLHCSAYICAHSCCVQREKNVPSFLSHPLARHTVECTARIGAYLHIASTIVFLVVIRPTTAEMTAWGSVYRDAYGEEDRFLQRGKPLIISRTRLAALYKECWQMATFKLKTNFGWTPLR